MFKRFRMAIQELEFQKHMELNGYDMDYAVHSYKQEYADAPNAMGIRLLLRWYHLQWYVVLAWFVVTGRRTDIIWGE